MGLVQHLRRIVTSLSHFVVMLGGPPRPRKPGTSFLAAASESAVGKTTVDFSYTGQGNIMTARCLPILLVFCLPALTWTVPAAAQEVYRWVDENGIVNFSDTAPAAAAADVRTLILEDNVPPDYDPEADIYNVAAQAERMQAMREQMDKQREERRERQRDAPSQPAVQYQQGVQYGYPYGYPAYPWPPFRPPARPPVKPRHEPYEISTLRPPGEMRNPDGR